MKKKTYTRKEFLEVAGIKSRQHYHYLLHGETRSDRPPILPPLKEGVDYINQEILFFESAVNKAKDITLRRSKKGRK